MVVSPAAGTELVLLGEGSTARVLVPGRTEIHPCSLEGPECGLIPLQHPAVASSTGLKWNLGAPFVLFKAVLDSSRCVAGILPSMCLLGQGLPPKWVMAARSIAVLRSYLLSTDTVLADNTRMQWGGLISTCNQMVADKVTVDTDAPLLWTTQYRDP